MPSRLHSESHQNVQISPPARQKLSLAILIDGLKIIAFRRKSCVEENIRQASPNVQIEQIRVAIRKKAAKNASNYDARDLKKLEKNQAYVKRFLKIAPSSKDSVKEAIRTLDNFMKWRKSNASKVIKLSVIPEETLE